MERKERKATKKQVEYLNDLQGEILLQCEKLGIQPEFTPRDWNEDLAMGMTETEASTRIRHLRFIFGHQNILLYHRGIKLY